jgi:glucose/arabinose dehydrogenase
MGEMRVRSRAVTVAVIAVAVVLVAGAGGAAACKLTSLNCHLRPAPEWQLNEAKGVTGGARSISPDLSASPLVRGLDYPTDFDFLPDGEMIVALRNGLIERVDHGRVVSRPVLDLRKQVNIAGLRGVMALVVDPSPARPVHFYVAYSVIDPKHPSPTSGKPTTVRVSRFTMTNGVAAPASERIIVGRVTGGSCVSQPTTDCLPGDADHIGTDIVFLRDGTLLISTGDGGPALGNVVLAQSTDALGGKILRVDRSGRGVPTNPFWNGNPNANRSKVWAYGFRNPFRISALPNGDVIVGDVGYNDVEELDLARRGADFGWPCLEGAKHTPAFRSTSFCQSYYAEHPHRAQAPWFAFSHPTWRTVIAGVSLADAKELPTAFRAQYAFADWAVSKVWVADPLTAHQTFAPTSHLQLIEAGAAGPVRLRVGRDGALYELSINTGELWRIKAHSNH